MDGLEAPEAALQEAWEEAGVRDGEVSPEPLGSYGYDKSLPGDWSVPVRTTVYPVKVLDLSEDYPEADLRARRWVSSAEAAKMIDEPELKEFVESF